MLTCDATMNILCIPGSTIDYDETYYENEEGYLYDESHFDMLTIRTIVITVNFNYLSIKNLWQCFVCLVMHSMYCQALIILIDFFLNFSSVSFSSILIISIIIRLHAHIEFNLSFKFYYYVSR